MKAGVVTPDTSVRINGKDSGNELREKEEEKGNVEKSSFENEFLFKDTFKKPKSGDNDGEEIYKEHFVKLKNLAGLRPEKKGSEEEEREEAETEELINFVCLGHGNSLAFTEGRELVDYGWMKWIL